MKGAKEFADIFGTGQHGRLFLVSGSHARGRTFHIYVLPTEEKITCMPWCHKDAVEVYGITGGQPGWTETYGWLHNGAWQADFAMLADRRKSEIAIVKAGKEHDAANQREAERQRQADLLATYP